jgi:hypothetical protein
VIELDVADHGHVRHVLQELGGLVEVGAVVLVTFDDEVTSSSQPVARPLFAEIERDTTTSTDGSRLPWVKSHPSATSSWFCRAYRQTMEREFQRK